MRLLRSPQPMVLPPSPFLDTHFLSMNSYPLIQKALSLPGTIFMGGSLGAGVPEGIVFVDVGIQQPRLHRKVAWFVVSGERLLAMYFRHDPATIQALYERHPDAVKPCERFPKYWSMLNLQREPGLGPGLLLSAYEATLGKLTKKGLALVKQIGGDTPFIDFHRAALELCATRENVHLLYYDGMDPQIHFCGQAFAFYHFGTLKVRSSMAWVFDEHTSGVSGGWYPSLRNGLEKYQHAMVEDSIAKLAEGGDYAWIHLDFLSGVKTPRAQQAVAEHRG